MKQLRSKLEIKGCYLWQERNYTQYSIFENCQLDLFRHPPASLTLHMRPSPAIIFSGCVGSRCSAPIHCALGL